MSVGYDNAQLTAEQSKRLKSPGAVDTSNFRAPVAVYVAVPIVTIILGALTIYSYCSWKRRMLRNREKMIEKVGEKRRRVSLLPGSVDTTKQVQKYGLSARSGKSGHDPAALITFSAAITGLATELDDVEQMVLEYHSYNAGEAIPEFQKVVVEDEPYRVTINPLYNSMQSGACGYVLSGFKNPVLGFTDAASRRMSIPFRLEGSAYIPAPPPEEEEEEEEEEGDENHGSDDENQDSASDTESTQTSATIGSSSTNKCSSADYESSPTDYARTTKKKSKRVMISEVELDP